MNTGLSEGMKLLLLISFENKTQIPLPIFFYCPSVKHLEMLKEKIFKSSNIPSVLVPVSSTVYCVPAESIHAAVTGEGKAAEQLDEESLNGLSCGGSTECL